MRDARNRRSRSYCIFRYLLLYTFQAPRLASFVWDSEVSSYQSFQWTSQCLPEGLSGVPRGSWSTPVSERDCKGTPFFFTCKLFRNFFQTFFTLFPAANANTLTYTALRADVFSTFFDVFQRRLELWPQRNPWHEDEKLRVRPHGFGKNMKKATGSAFSNCRRLTELFWSACFLWLLLYAKKSGGQHELPQKGWQK